MDYEKAYKEALERAKNYCDGHHTDVNPQKAMECIFPELKESEGERIRKGLIKGLSAMRDIHNHQTFSDDSIDINDAIAWLERQGEQKPKHFELKAGHWYVCHRAFCCRADDLTVKEGERFMCEKDGVVKGFVINDPEEYFKEVCAHAPIEIEQRPSWSEEDEDAVDIAIRIIQNGGDDCAGILDSDKALKWLKSIKNRVQPQPKQEWSEDDKKMINKIIDELNPYGECPDYPSPEEQEYYYTRQEMIDFLKSIKPQQNLYDKCYNDGYSAAKYNHWKPSEEQINSLLALSILHKESKALESLYNDLKKL